ncbi:hypothetical protein JTE90_026021 [Oedothorax gibbosus]|uniref:Transferrin-like domain-containing protein n=1 Tax=Oedothorax gibbosus TaxID=931172 RepID=A0AAV6U2N0_9ARAC|nr:hypothetical protein JTE90_026021 [Oedothorax gibbosus]
MVEREEADVTNADPRALYIAGRFYKLRPVATELVNGVPFLYQSVAVVPNKSSSIKSPSDLVNATSCHAGMDDVAGWHIPLAKLLSQGTAEQDCQEGDLGVARDFFGGSCVPGQWSADPLVDRELSEWLLFL